MKYFTIEELCNSATANRLGIWNWPVDNYIFDNLNALVDNILDPAREELRVPIFVNSGYRSKELNIALNGAKNSQHMKGEAADICCRGNNLIELFKILKKLDFDQLILYRKKNFCHVSYVTHRKNRNQVIIN